MSEGPIARERAAHRAPVAQKVSEKVHRAHKSRASYCGRRGQKVESWREVSCVECWAARRADKEAK